MPFSASSRAVARLPLWVASFASFASLGWFTLFVTFPSVALAADETVDRAAIETTIAGLNHFPRSTALFTEDAISERGRLPDVKPTSARIGAPSGDPALGATLPTVTISHDPWGEATINFPGSAVASGGMGMEVLNPRITSGEIRFLTPDIAVVDGRWTYKSGEKTDTAPLLFVMKRDGGIWKIASLRLLAQ